MALVSECRAFSYQIPFGSSTRELQRFPIKRILASIVAILATRS